MVNLEIAKKVEQGRNGGDPMKSLMANEVV